MMAESTTTAMVKIIELLTPFESEDRKRIVSAAFTMLGETHVAIKNMSDNETSDESSTIDLPTKVKTWMKQNALTSSELEHLFHIDGNKVEVIAPEIPGKTDKERTLNAYILMGIVNFLSLGTPDFDDKSARALCKSFACLNESNHAVYLKAKGNEFRGTKEEGWSLTAPGLKAAVSLIKEMSKAS